MKASEARQISDSQQPEKAVESILERIKEAAKAGKYNIRVTDHGFGDSKLYEHGARGWGTLQRNIAEQLMNLGYEVFQTSECKQFVDIYLEISWNKA